MVTQEESGNSSAKGDQNLSEDHLDAFRSLIYEAILEKKSVNECGYQSEEGPPKNEILAAVLRSQTVKTSQMDRWAKFTSSYFPNEHWKPFYVYTLYFETQ